MRTGVITQDVPLDADASTIYEALMDSEKHAKFTGLPADISSEIGGRIMAGDGYIEGENIELVKDRLIVQDWRGSDFPEGHYSHLTIELMPRKGGITLRLIHTDVPEDLVLGIDEGWHKHYWEPLRAYLKGL
jgi:activator of HSP90 ATPase